MYNKTDKIKTVGLTGGFDFYRKSIGVYIKDHQGIEQISSVVQTNSATAEESAATSDDLLHQAKTLLALVQKFKLR